ncbi:MAG: hypothetical protein M1826_001718 [Phylliscum demangeonii]|nr:MAG: hypothetical protein M1826_001718 [Phylliscum demangeonii]
MTSMARNPWDTIARLEDRRLAARTCSRCQVALDAGKTVICQASLTGNPSAKLLSYFQWRRTGHAVALHRPASADHSALTRVLRRLQRTPGYAADSEAGSEADRRRAEANTEAALMYRRWEQQRSAEWAYQYEE